MIRALLIFVVATAGCQAGEVPIAGRVGGLLDLKPFALRFDASTTRISLPVGPLGVTATHHRSSRLGPGKFTWFGRTQKGGIVVLTQNGGRLVGTVYEGTSVYRVLSGPGDRIYVGRVRPSRRGRHAQEYKHGKPPEVVTEDGPIRILAAYTHPANEACPNIETDIEHAVELANLVMENSGLSTTFEHAGSVQLGKTFDESNYAMDALVELLADPHNIDFRVVHERRKERAADLVMLFIRPTDGIDGAATMTMPTAREGFAAVSCDDAIDDLSYVHELGHLLGLNDDWDLPDEATFSYGFGHINDYADPTRSWRTIMASSGTCKHDCPRMPYWSNPAVSIGSDPTGTKARSDNARVIRATAGAVSRFAP